MSSLAHTSALSTPTTPCAITCHAPVRTDRRIAASDTPAPSAGPLVRAVPTAGRGIRQGDGAATAAAARMARIYSYASVLVVLLGFGLMSSKRSGKTIADFSDTWIWLSALLWLIALVLTLGAIV